MADTWLNSRTLRQWKQIAHKVAKRDFEQEATEIPKKNFEIFAISLCQSLFLAAHS